MNKNFALIVVIAVLVSAGLNFQIKPSVTGELAPHLPFCTKKAYCYLDRTVYSTINCTHKNGYIVAFESEDNELAPTFSNAKEQGFIHCYVKKVGLFPNYQTGGSNNLPNVPYTIIEEASK